MAAGALPLFVVLLLFEASSAVRLRSKEEGGPPPAGEDFAVGSNVEIFGLHTKALNGLLGQVKAWDKSTQRFVVQVPDGSFKKVKPSHLKQVLVEDPSGSSPSSSSSPPVSSPSSEAAAAAAVPSPAPPSGGADAGVSQQEIGPGTRVRLFGLKSAADLNGQTGVVRGFDEKSGRFVVALSHGKPRRLTRAHLEVLSLGEQDAEGHWVRGTHVEIVGLHSAKSLNGLVGVVGGFDVHSGRYVVKVPDMDKPKKITAEHLRVVAGPGDGGGQDGEGEESEGGEDPGGLRGLLEAAAGGRRPEEAQQQEDPKQVAQEKAAEAACKNATADAGSMADGTEVRVVGLKKAVQLNLKLGRVRCFDEKLGRYVVEMEEGQGLEGAAGLKKMKPERLAFVAPPGLPDTKPEAPPVWHEVPKKKEPKMLAQKKKEVSGLLQQGGVGVNVSLHGRPGSKAGAAPAAPAAPKAPPAPKEKRKLSVCNAYPFHTGMSGFVLAPDGTQYADLFQNLKYQSCKEVTLPSQAGTLQFAVGKMQVASRKFNTTKLPKRTQLLVAVYRDDPNSLKAGLRLKAVNPNPRAYTMLVFNGYTGSKLINLRAARGDMVMDQMKWNKEYRLNKEEQMDLTLTDGFGKLNVGFDPQNGKVYCAIATGIDPGLKGEPRNLGLVVHELGAFTAAEEMSGDGQNFPAAFAANGGAPASEPQQAQQPAPPPTLRLRGSGGPGGADATEEDKEAFPSDSTGPEGKLQSLLKRVLWR